MASPLLAVPGGDVQMFMHGQIIITVVVEGATGQHLRSKCQLAFHSRSLRVSLPLLLSRVENSRSGTGSTSGEQVRVP